MLIRICVAPPDKIKIHLEHKHLLAVRIDITSKRFLCTLIILELDTIITTFFTFDYSIHYKTILDPLNISETTLIFTQS